MKRAQNINIRLFLVTLFSLLLTKTAAFTLFFGSTFIGWVSHFFMLLVLLPMIKYAVLGKEKLFTIYAFVMITAFVFHVIVRKPAFDINFWEVSSWILIVYLMYISREIKFQKPILFYVALFFFMAECSIAILERITSSWIFQYDSEILDSFILEGDISQNGFRSFSMLGHPLNNANVVSLFLGFLLVNHKLKKKYKILLMLIGLLALWAFNSRGAILIWIIILIVRFVLYKINLLHIMVPSIILILVAPYAVEWINSGALGRFSFDFSDSSALTRLSSFIYFQTHNWNLENILLGGDLIYMPGTDLIIENGVLLNMSYWGWVIGTLKIFLEIYITYRLLNQYANKEKFVLLLSFWGVALMNNNVFNPLVLTFFLFAYSAFYVTDISSYSTSPTTKQ